MGQQIDLISNPKKSFWKLNMPIIDLLIFDAVYGMVDMFWVSQLNNMAIII